MDGDGCALLERKKLCEFVDVLGSHDLAVQCDSFEKLTRLKGFKFGEVLAALLYETFTFAHQYEQFEKERGQRPSLM